MPKPILYIDVDGVLFGLYGDPESFQLRPGVTSFLRWATERFECRWLTAWPQDRMEELMRRIYASQYLTIVYADWRPNSKTDGIDFSAAEWFWIEDGINESEEATLQARGCYDRFIYVDARGADELERVRQVLAAKLASLETKGA